MRAHVQIVLQRDDEREQNRHAKNAKQQPEPHALLPRFADFVRAARTVLLGDDGVERRHDAHEGDEQGGEHRAAQRHGGEVVFARRARHGGVHHADGNGGDLPEHHGDGEGEQLAGFVFEIGGGIAGEVKKHGERDGKGVGFRLFRLPKCLEAA